MPVAGGILHQLAVSYALYNIRGFVAVGENGVFRVALKRSPDIFRSRVGYHVTVLGTALGCHKIIHPAYFVHVGAFEKSSACALPDAGAPGELSSGRYIYLALYHAADAVVILAVADEINPSFVKQQRRVDAALIDGYGIRPFTVNIVRPDVEILMLRIIGRHKIEPSVVKAQSWREYPAGAVDLIEVHLGGTCQRIPYLRPVHKVVAFEKRNAREIMKRACRKIVFTVCTADRRVGVKAFDNRVAVLHSVILLKKMTMRFYCKCHKIL